MSPEAQGAGIGFMTGFLADVVIFSVRVDSAVRAPVHPAHTISVPHYLANHAAQLEGIVNTHRTSLTDLQYAEVSNTPRVNKLIHQAEASLERTLHHERSALKIVKRREAAYITKHKPKTYASAGILSVPHDHPPEIVHAGELYGSPLAAGAIVGALAVAGWQRLVTARKKNKERERTNEEIIESFRATMDIDLLRLSRKK